MTTTDDRDIPVLTHDIGTSGPVGCHFAEWDEVREKTPAFWNDVGDGHWVVTRFEAIRHALQDPSVFSNESTIVGQPEPEYKMIPTFLDPPEHTKFRQLYNARFAPAVINRITPDARAACNRSITPCRSATPADIVSAVSGWRSRSADMDTFFLEHMFESRVESECGQLGDKLLEPPLAEARSSTAGR